MGSFRGFEDISNTRHLMMSGSGKADVFAHDIIRRVHSVDIDSVYEVKDKKGFANMAELSVIQPFTSGRWFFKVEYAKVKGLVKLNKGIFESETSVYLFIVDRYADYKELKELLGGGINDVYTPIIRRDDMYFLFRDAGLSEKVIIFISSSYAREPEKVFELKEYTDNGFEITSQKDVVKLVGASSGTVNTFVIGLLRDKPATERGLKRSLKQKVQMGKDLCDAYGVSTFRNFLASCIYDMLQIKVLYMQGVIYNSISDLPEGFDEAKLSKYKYCLEVIKNEFSYNDLMRLYNKIQEPNNRRWYSVRDMLGFIYDVYESERKEVVV